MSIQKYKILIGVVGLVLVASGIVVALTRLKMQRGEATDMINYLQVDFAGDMTGEEKFVLDTNGIITRTTNDYVNVPSTTVSKRALQASDKAPLNAILQKYNATAIVGDTSLPPDARYAYVKFTLDGKTHEYRCIDTLNDCAKLAQQLRSTLESLLSQ